MVLAAGRLDQCGPVRACSDDISVTIGESARADRAMASIAAINVGRCADVRHVPAGLSKVRFG